MASDQITFIADDASGQGLIGYAALAAECKAAWEKVSEGTGYVNPYWRDAKINMAATHGLIARGGYMFPDQGASGFAQADFFADVAGNMDGFGIFIDGEPDTHLGSYPDRPTIVTVAERLRERYPHKPIGGYLPHWYWQQANWVGVVDYLISSVYVNGIGSPTYLYSLVPSYFWDGYGGLPVAELQFTSTCIEPGVPGLSDCNAFRGTPDEYAKLILGPTAPPPPPPPPADWEAVALGRLPVIGHAHADAHPSYNARCQGLLAAAGVKVKITHSYDVATEHAVKIVQRAHGLAVDGICGPHTWHVLATGGDPARALPLLVPSEPDKHPAFNGRCQGLLDAAFGGHTTMTHKYDAVTVLDVKTLQREHGLAVDGVTGPETWSVLLSGSPVH